MCEVHMPDMREATAVILAGGLGTRLKPIVNDRPKVLSDVNARPFLSYLLDQIGDAGIRRVVLCTGYKSEQVFLAFGRRYSHLTVAYSTEEEPLGTGGALRRALPLITSDPALVMNGDSYFQADLDDFFNRHQVAGATISMMLAHADDAGRYGMVETGTDGAVLKFTEKGPNAGPGWINAGMYLLGRGSLESIPQQRFVSLEQEILPACIGKGFFGFKYQGEFIDIGTPESYRAASEFMQNIPKISTSHR
jgi:NDP-sugar pyrophosphorylase family protein